MLAGIEKDDLMIIQGVLEQYASGYEVRAFGSRVNGTHKQFSDLDLVFIGNGAIPFSILSRIRTAFSESNLPFKVDVIDWADIDDNFKKMIINNQFILQNNLIS